MKKLLAIIVVNSLIAQNTLFAFNLLSPIGTSETDSIKSVGGEKILVIGDTSPLGVVGDAAKAVLHSEQKKIKHTMIKRVKRFLFLKLNGYTVDAIFLKYVQEKDRVTFKTFLDAVWNFLKEGLSEKLSYKHLKLTFKECMMYARTIGSDFFIFAMIWWVWDDFIMPAIFIIWKMPAIATFVLFGHFEPLAYPSYFVVRSFFFKHFKGHLKPSECEKVKARMASEMFRKRNFAERYNFARFMLQATGPALLSVFLNDIEVEYEPREASHVEFYGERELSIKYLGRLIAKAGIKTAMARKAVERIYQLIDDEDPWVRKVSIGAFAKFSHRFGIKDFDFILSAYEKIKQRLDIAVESDEIVRGAAARTMQIFPSRIALLPLVETVSNPAEDNWVKYYAIRSIGEIFKHLAVSDEIQKDGSILKTLGLLYSHMDYRQERSVEIRIASIDALAKYPLSQSLTPKDSSWRFCIDRLYFALSNDPDPTAREHALFAMAKKYLCDSCTDDSVEEFSDILNNLLDSEYINVAELSLRYLKYIYYANYLHIPKTTDNKLKKLSKAPKNKKPVVFVAVDSFYDPEIIKNEHKLDSPQAQQFVDRMRTNGHLVFYTRNFLADRSVSELKPDGSIYIFSSFNTPKFSNTISRLKAGRVAHVDWIDFPRGRVASQRTIIPNPKGCIVVVGSQEELELLSNVVAGYNPLFMIATGTNATIVLDRLNYAAELAEAAGGGLKWQRPAEIYSDKSL